MLCVVANFYWNTLCHSYKLAFQYRQVCTLADVGTNFIVFVCIQVNHLLMLFNFVHHPWHQILLKPENMSGTLRT